MNSIHIAMMEKLRGNGVSVLTLVVEGHCAAVAYETGSGRVLSARVLDYLGRPVFVSDYPAEVGATATRAMHRVVLDWLVVSERLDSNVTTYVPVFKGKIR